MIRRSSLTVFLEGANRWERLLCLLSFSLYRGLLQWCLDYVDLQLTNPTSDQAISTLTDCEWLLVVLTLHRASCFKSCVGKLKAEEILATPESLDMSGQINFGKVLFSSVVTVGCRWRSLSVSVTVPTFRLIKPTHPGCSITLHI